MALNEYSRMQKAGLLVANWIVFLSAPIWAPLHFWHYVFGDFDLAKKMFTGKGSILD